jgi:hypothetical protein
MAVGFDDLVQPEGAANDGAKLTTLDECLEEFEVGLHGRGGPAMKTALPVTCATGRADSAAAIASSRPTSRRGDTAPGFSARRLRGKPALPMTSQTTS